MMAAACRRYAVGAPVGACQRLLLATRAARGGLVPRCRAAASAASDDEVARRRLWRWGSATTSTISPQDVVEVSADPVLMEDISGVTHIACGSGHSAFVREGQVYTFGSNKYNQLGVADAGQQAPSIHGTDPAPVEFELPDGLSAKVVDVSLGGFHSAAITEGGYLWTWGWGGSFWWGAGGLGHGSRTDALRPVLVRQFLDDGEMVKQVACGGQHTILLTTEGRLYATGKGEYGRLGRGSPRDELEFEEIEYFSQSNDSVLEPGQPITIVKVGAGENFSAALSRGGELWVWGRNDYGQLGLGEEAMGDFYSAERYPRLVRTLPMEGHRVIDFACGEHHVVALTAAGSLYEWGSRTWLEPHPISLPGRFEDGLNSIVKVAAGDKFSLCLTRDGQLYSWGSKASGCLAQGPGAPKTLLEPTLVPSETFEHQRIVDIAASKWRCLAITQEDGFSA